MRLNRSAGLLLHPTSLPGGQGIGDLGPGAHRFIDLLASAGVSLWQMLPLGPTGYGNSPYQCFSSFAGNPLLIHIAGEHASGHRSHVDFPEVIRHKKPLLKSATDAFVPDAGYHAWVESQEWWLEDFSLFMALKEAHGGVAWTDWDKGAALRDPDALADWRDRLGAEIEHHRRVQALFFMQFGELKAAARKAGVSLMGDVPIYVAHDSADVWANRDLFQLDETGHLIVQAGVPPDYFSATGQLWGNPIYRWEAMRGQDYAWWIRRMQSAFALFDVVRIDHFRGFEAFWEVPADEETAVNGRWVKGPGPQFFEAITQALGPLPIVAENLGVITPAVEALRHQFAYPGMSILQFAFGTDDQANSFLPHNYARDLVVYTGTHDNDTTMGWWDSSGTADSTRTPEDVAREKEHALDYLGVDGSEMNWTLIRTAFASVADTAIIPMQDLIGLGSESRMNLPGRESGNWSFRFSWDQVSSSTLARLKNMVELYGRRPAGA